MFKRAAPVRGARTVGNDKGTRGGLMTPLRLNRLTDGRCQARSRAADLARQPVIPYRLHSGHRNWTVAVFLVDGRTAVECRRAGSALPGGHRIPGRPCSWARGYDI